VVSIGIKWLHADSASCGAVLACFDVTKDILADRNPQSPAEVGCELLICEALARALKELCNPQAVSRASCAADAALRLGVALPKKVTVFNAGECKKKLALGTGRCRELSHVKNVIYQGFGQQSACFASP
jgi:hypothetical protein